MFERLRLIPKRYFNLKQNKYWITAGNNDNKIKAAMRTGASALGKFLL